MDRLSTVKLGALVICIAWQATVACEGDAPPSTQRRVVSVAADRSGAPDLSSFCDAQGSGDGARRLTFPPLDGGPESRLERSSWRWVNVWATWCRPCIEEMPMLVGWSDRLESEGASLSLTFLSVDESAELVDRFRATHPGTPPSLRLSDPEALGAWIVGLGLDPGATLPIHVFADPEGRVRCVRSGALTESHFETVRYLLGSR